MSAPSLNEGLVTVSLSWVWAGALSRLAHDVPHRERLLSGDNRRCAQSNERARQRDDGKTILHDLFLEPICVSA
jgi:hypothetical protein